MRALAAVLVLAGCGSSEPPPVPETAAVAAPAATPAAPVEPGPLDVLRTACLDQMPGFDGSEAALKAAGLQVGREPSGTLVAQGRGIGVLIVGTTTTEGEPALGCLVGARGLAAAAVEPLRAMLVNYSTAVTESTVREQGLEGLRWSWAAGDDAGDERVTVELFDDPASGEAKMLLTVPRAAG